MSVLFYAQKNAKQHSEFDRSLDAEQTWTRMRIMRVIINYELNEAIEKLNLF